MEEESVAASIWASMNSWFTPTILFIFLNLMIATILFTSNLPNNQQQKPQDPNEKPPANQNDLTPSKLARSPSILHRLKSLSLYPHRSQNELSPLTNHHHEQQALEAAATQYVFNHPFTHEQDLQPNNLDFNPTHFESESDSNQTNEVQLSNAQTHFVLDNHTVEKVTTHFDFNPDPIADENPPEEDADLGEIHDEETDDFKSLDEVYSKITGGHVNRTKSDTLPASGEVPVKLPAKMKKSASLKSAFSHFEEDKIVEARRPATVRERRTAARETKDGDVEVDAKADDFINKFKHQLKLQRLDSIIRYNVQGYGK